MRLYLNTATPTTRLEIGDEVYEWGSKRDLAKGLLKYIEDRLADNGLSWRDITELHYFSGPGSFTGLRIGAVVVNTLADQLNIPLFDHHGERREVIIPDYGRSANTTPPKS